MRYPFALTLALAAAVSGCTSSDRTPAGSAGSTQAPDVTSAKARGLANASIRPAIASFPDRGELLSYTQPASAVGGSKAAAQPVAISEEHAFRAIQRKELVLNAPDGERITIPYSRHQDHGDGNWTWFGRDANGASTVLTFGQDAVFGSVQRPDGSELRITTQHRRTYAVVVQPNQFRGVETSTGADYLIVPEGIAPGSTKRASAAQRDAAGAVKQTAAATAAAANEVDVLLGYSNGLAARIGSAAGAETRLRNLIAFTNEAYQNSGVTYRVRLVGTLQVNYGDSTKNDATLESLTGSNGSGSVPVDPAFNALRAAREQTGADLVSFVRQFRDPEQDGCGIAWLLGGGQSTIDQSDAAFAYSVVSDGSDLNEGDNKTYFCRDETLAHELGHTMGQAHNSEDSSSSGAHAYSYGYREASTTGFFTVMAYRITDSNQVGIRYFANPNVLHDGRPTGVASQSDNVRSMNQTMPIVAQFRVSSIPAMPSLYAFSKLGASGRTEVHVMPGSNLFSSYTQNVATALHQTGRDSAWQFQIGDFNRDGTIDVYAISKQGASGRTEVHVMNGATGFSTYLANIATALHSTGTDATWQFRLADYNRDGILDLYAIGRQGYSGRTEIHVLNGATNFTSFLANLASALATTGAGYSWNFCLGDMNRDGYPDLFAVSKLGPGSNTTELHVLDGANAFQRFILQTPTALHQTGSSNGWLFKTGDFDGDSVLDLYAVNKVGASGRTEVHVLNGARGFLAFSAHLATVLHGTGTDNSWDFEVGPSR